MYIALRNIKAQDSNGKLVTLKRGEPVDTSAWSDRVIRAHVNQHMIEKALIPVKMTVKRKKKTSQVEG